MIIEEIIITENTTVNEMLKFLDITLETFYYEFITEGIDRGCYWRSFKNNNIILTKK